MKRLLCLVRTVLTDGSNGGKKTSLRCGCERSIKVKFDPKKWCGTVAQACDLRRA